VIWLDPVNAGREDFGALWRVLPAPDLLRFATVLYNVGSLLTAMLSSSTVGLRLTLTGRW